MSNYDLYNKVIEALKENDEGSFNAAARNWIEEADIAKFEDDDANELFFAAKHYCKLWRSKAINGRVSKLRMIENVRKIAEKNLPNPYKEEPEEVVEEEVKEEPKHVFGVLETPESENGFSPASRDEPAEEPEEEKRFFGKRNKKR